MKHQAVSQNQRSRRILIIAFPIAILCTGVAAFAILNQPYYTGRYVNWITSVTILHDDGRIEKPTRDKAINCMIYPVYRGIFAIEIYDFVNNYGGGRPAIEPIPMNASAEFYMPQDYQNDRINKNAKLHKIRYDKFSESAVASSRSRFIGRVWLRREVLWTLFGIPAATALFTGTRLFIIARPLRRLKRGLCTHCKYPLPMENENPQCPECGTIHTMNAITANEAAAALPNASSPSESANN